MAPIQQSEDFIRALSRIVFACIPPGQSVIKLSDPITGALEDYKLVKVSSASETYCSRAIRHPYLSKTRSTPQLDTEDILHFFNVVIRKENISEAPQHKQSSASSTFPQLQALSRNNSKSRSSRLPLARKDPKTVRIPAGSEDCSDTNDAPIASGSLTQIKRAMFLRELREDKRRPFTVLPPAFPALGKNSSPPPLDDSHPSDADTSSSSPDSTPAKALFPQDSSSTECTPARAMFMQDSSFDTSTSTIGFASSGPSRLVGLGFTALVKDDGSPFDGLGPLTGRLYDNIPSPSDEARARARERRDRRIFSAIQIRDGAGVTLASTPQPSTTTQSQADRLYAMSAKVTTPVSVTVGERVPPAAPAKRVIGRMPFGVDERMMFRTGPGREKQPDRDVFVFHRERPSPEWQTSVGRTQGVRSGRRPSPGSLAPPTSGAGEDSLGNELRFWSYWMTPMNEVAGSGGRPAWRP